MSRKFSIDNIDEFFYKQKQTKKFSKELNHIEVVKKQIDKNITIFKSTKPVGKEVTVPIKYDPKGLFIGVALDGKMDYRSHLSGFGEEFRNVVQKDQTYLTLMNKEEGVNHLSKDTNIKNIMILVQNEFLDNYLLNKLKNQDDLKRNYENSRSKILSKKKTSTKTAILANEIYHSPFTGDLDEIYTQSKVYEIIYHEFKDYIEAEKTIKQKFIKFSDEDIQRLHYAKKLIKEEQRYLSLKQLSRAVALNEFKLKYGFKNLFGISIGAMILKEKMEQAKILVESSELSIHEIAQIVGYKYSSNFAVAFRRYFGVNPSEIMRKREYYY